MTYNMHRFIHVTTPYRYRPLLTICQVPESIEVDELRDLIERAGREEGEFDIPWANTYIAKIDSDTPSALVGAMRKIEHETLSYTELQQEAAKPFCE